MKNKWKSIPCSLFGRIHIKVSILPRAIYKLNATNLYQDFNCVFLQKYNKQSLKFMYPQKQSWARIIKHEASQFLILSCIKRYSNQTWVSVGSRSWCWTGKPGMLQSMGSQKVRHNSATELNWKHGHKVKKINKHSISN